MNTPGEKSKESSGSDTPVTARLGNNIDESASKRVRRSTVPLNEENFIPVSGVRQLWRTQMMLRQLQVAPKIALRLSK